MKLSLVIEAIDKASRNVKRITGNVREIGTRGMAPVARATQAANSRLQRFGSGFVGRVTAMATAARHFAGRMGMKAIEKAAYGAGYAIGWTIRKGAALAGAAIRWGTAGAAFAAGWGVGGIIRTASQFEQFQVILENTEGSVDRARKAMSWVKDFAKTTPYEIGNVMEAFVQLRAYGMDPMNGTMRSLGNMASGMGKDILQAVEMMADAQTGEFERLKEFGIRGSKEGEKATFTFVKNGKEVRKTVAMNAAAINKAIRDIADDRFSGMMDRQSRTIAGMWSNLQDTFANFQLDVADAGFFDVVKGKVQQILDKVNELAANGTLAKWAENVSAWLTQATEAGAKFIQEIDWKQLGTDVKNAGTLLWGIVKVMAALGKLVGEVAASFGWLGEKMSWLNRHRTSDLVGLTTPKKEIPFSAPKSTGKGWPARMSNSLQPVPRRSTAPLLNGAKPAAWPGTGKPVAVGGKLEIELKGSGAAGARVKSVRSANKDVPISVYRGQSMAGAA